MASDIHLEEKEIKLADLKVAKELWPFIRPYGWMLVLSTMLIFLVTFFELLLPIFTQKAFDGFIVPVGSEKGIEVFNKAIENFKLCIKYKPEKANAYYFLAITYENIGDNNNAKKYFDIAYKLNPELKNNN